MDYLTNMMDKKGVGITYFRMTVEKKRVIIIFITIKKFLIENLCKP